MRRVTAALALIGLVAAPALAQSPGSLSPGSLSPAPSQSPPLPQSVAPLPQAATPVSAAAPALTLSTPSTCTCVPPPVRQTYRRTTYRRRSAPVPSYSTSITPGPFVFGAPQDVRYLPSPAPPAGFAQFDISGYFRGLGPNGTGLEDGTISDGIMGGAAGQGGPGPDNIGW